jgi:hypothetical protein
MGYVLLWIENLAVSLLLVATITAFTARLQHKWLRLSIWAALVILIFLAYLALTIITGIIQFRLQLAFNWFYPALMLLLFYTSGVLRLKYAASKPSSDDPSAAFAAFWPRGKLAFALGVVIALHIMTFWNLNLEAQQQAAMLRSEAGAIALSLEPPRISDKDNAALLYEQAAEALDKVIQKMPKQKISQWDMWRNSLAGSKFNAKDPELAAFLKEQSGTISLIHQGVNKAGCNFGQDYHSMGPKEYKQWMEINKLASLLAMDSYWKASTGDRKTAMNDINAIFGLAEHISSDPLLIAAAGSAVIDTSAIRVLQNLVITEKLRTDDLNAVKIDNGYSYKKLMQRAFHCEEIIRLVFLGEIGDKYPFSRYFGGSSEDIPGELSFYRVFLLNYEIKAQQWYSNQLDMFASQPYFKVKNQWKQFSAYPPDAPPSLLTRANYFSANRIGEELVKADAQRDVLKTALAASRYKAKNGAYPEKLDELVTDFLPFVPIDPFDGKPIRFKKTDGKYLVYSVGRDGIDDGGVPFDSKSDKDDITFELPNK